MKKTLLILTIAVLSSCGSSEKECNHDGSHTVCDTTMTDTIQKQNVEVLLDSLNSI